MALTEFFNLIFGWLVEWNALGALIIITFLMTLIVTLIYKYATNQEAMKSAKDEMKEIQKKIKEAKDDPNKMMEHNKELMQKQMTMFKESFKPMLITLLPILLLFGWLNATLIYEPILPNQEFNTTLKFNTEIIGNVEIITPEFIKVIGNKIQEIKKDEEKEEWIARWTLKGDEGMHTLKYKFKDKIFDKKVLITKEQKYEKPIEEISEENLIIEINNNKKIFLDILGWKIGWLGTYIIFSLLFNMTLRKLLKVH